MAERLGKMVEHPDQSQPNPGPQADGSPCSILHSSPPVELVVVLVPLDGVERAALHVELAGEPSVVAVEHVGGDVDVLQRQGQRA